MSSPAKKWLVHIGPLRQESEALIKKIALPSFVITPSDQKIEGMCEGLKYVSAMITPEAGVVTFYRYNLPGFDSLSPATGLQVLYPGISEVQRESLETQSLEELMNENASTSVAITHLVLEQPELAVSLLNTWHSKSMLDRLEILYVRTSHISLYKDMPTQKELIEWCSHYGFEMYRVVDSEDPDFVLQEFKRNTLYLPLKSAQDQIEKLENNKLELESELEAAVKDNHDIQEKLEKTNQFFLNRKQEAEDRKEQLEKVKKEYNSLSEKYDKLIQLADERQQQLHELQRHNQKLKIDNQQLSERQVQLKNELIRTESHVEIIKELMLNG